MQIVFKEPLVGEAPRLKMGTSLVVGARERPLLAENRLIRALSVRRDALIDTLVAAGLVRGSHEIGVVRQLIEQAGGHAKLNIATRRLPAPRRPKENRHASTPNI